MVVGIEESLSDLPTSTFLKLDIGRAKKQSFTGAYLQRHN